MAKLRHIAMSVPDPEKAAEFYCKAFDMERLCARESSLANGVFLSDGVICLALLKFKSDAQGPKDYVGLHHIGFWVDDIRDAEKQVEEAGADYLMGRPKDGEERTTFFEEKYRDPNGVIIDITDLGWGGSVKDVVPKEEAEADA